MAVSVVIPAYNAEKDMEGCLASIAAQTVPPLEILVCDDGSKDATLAVLEGYGGAVQGVKGKIPLKIFKQANAGAGAARNRCLAEAQGDVVAFLDADDRWYPDKLARSLEELERGGHVFVAHNFEAAGPGEKPVLWDCVASANRKTWPAKDMMTHYFYRGFVGILTVVMRKEALLKAGGFDAEHRYMLDWECWHAVLAANPGSTFGLFSDVLALYALNPGGLTSKGMARLHDRELFVACHVRPVAARGGVAWPLLLFRGWLTIQYETLSLLLKNRQWGNAVLLGLRAPFSLLRAFGRALGPYSRKNFLQS